MEWFARKLQGALWDEEQGYVDQFLSKILLQHEWLQQSNASGQWQGEDQLQEILWWAFRCPMSQQQPIAPNSSRWYLQSGGGCLTFQLGWSFPKWQRHPERPLQRHQHPSFHLGVGLASDRWNHIKVLIVSWGDEFSIDEVTIPISKVHFSTRSVGISISVQDCSWRWESPWRQARRGW